MSRVDIVKIAVCIVVIVMVASVAESALAKDLCLEDNFGGSYVFQKVKALKKPGKGTPLHGWYLAVDISPMAGSAVVGSDGTVRAAVTIYSVDQGAVSFVMGWTGGATLAGTGDYDNDDSGTSNGSITLTSVDCKTITLP